MVHILFRHGIRTPTLFYPNDPYRNEKFYPYGLGQITNEGKQDAYQLGKFLRKEYDDFLGEKFSYDQVHVRSREILRLRMTALLVLAGLFPPTKEQIWNEDLMWLPIPVDYEPFEQEILIVTQGHCALEHKFAYDEYLKTPEFYEKYRKPYEKIYEIVDKYSGFNNTIPIDLLNLYHTLCSEDKLGYPLPNWTNLIYPDELSKASFTFYTSTAQVSSKTPLLGFLLKNIIRDTKNKLENKLVPESRKMFLYSVHDINIGYFLAVLGAFDLNVPGYGAALSLEVHQIDGDNFMKVRYKSDKSVDYFEDLVVPGCTPMCPMDKFIELIANQIPDQDLEDKCRNGGSKNAAKFFYNENIDSNQR